MRERIYNPLAADHPLVTDGDTCWICGKSFQGGQRTMLKPCESFRPNVVTTVQARAVHATCGVRGSTFYSTEDGLEHVIDRIKDGDASPFPVLTTDGKQWTLEEAGLSN